MSASDSIFRFVEVDDTIPADLGEEAYRFKAAEVKLIDELRIPKPRVHKVLPGESLWTIAGQYYSDPKLFSVLEQVNDLKGKVLPRGGQVIVPTQTELCAEVRAGRMVLPGDTVWALRKKHADYVPSSRDFRSRSLSLIYPYEKLNLPDSPQEQAAN